MPAGDVTFVLPAYQPGKALLRTVQRLAAAPFAAIVVVNDGSGPESDIWFAALRSIPKVHVLEHAVNLGKGAALKTGLNYALCNLPTECGVVTADADGQHDPEDIISVASLLAHHPESLILGVREFKKGIPLRSLLGNNITRGVLRAVLGQKFADSQTGLRGIPRPLAMQLLRIPSNGYEFELDMLIACKHHSYPILETPIQALYFDGNSSSHFNPVLDSMKIYFVLLRFSMIAILTAILDNLIFWAAFRSTHSLLESQVAGRLVAMVFNYLAARRAVFLSQEAPSATVPKYVLLVAFNGVISYAIITVLMARFSLPAAGAKLLAETALFLANFTIQRDFIFKTNRVVAAATDWNEYYTKVPFTARLTRKYTAKTLVAAIQRYCGERPRIVEIGGANSCFLDGILQKLKPRAYHIIDNNRYGLDLLQQVLSANSNVSATQMNVLDLKSGASPEADLVFSIGLVEHFDPEGTRRAIAAHFDLLPPGGCAIISFPTPTWLYRIARSICEALGLWKFPDERPLPREEVLSSMTEHGDVLFEKTLWPLVFTQRFIVARKWSVAAVADKTC